MKSSEKALQSLQSAITDGTVKDAEPGEALTRIVDILAVKPTNAEKEKLKKYGFAKYDETHYSNDDDTLVKFKIKGKAFWMQVVTESYEFSIHNKLSNFIENYEPVEA